VIQKIARGELVGKKAVEIECKRFLQNSAEDRSKENCTLTAIEESIPDFEVDFLGDSDVQEMIPCSNSSEDPLTPPSSRLKRKISSPEVISVQVDGHKFTCIDWKSEFYVPVSAVLQFHRRSPLEKLGNKIPNPQSPNKVAMINHKSDAVQEELEDDYLYSMIE